MNRYLISILLVVFCSCKEQFDLELNTADKSLLVVEGVLNVNGPTTINLSRSVPVNQKQTAKPELKAKLSVENNNGVVANLNETGNGSYSHPNLNLITGQEYRLRIRTTDNKEYLSEYIVAKQSPPIDSLSWSREFEGVMVYANSHDPTNNTRYYKWDFDETWEIWSNFSAEFAWISGTTIVPADRYHSTCWKFGKSTTINLGTTAQLTSDVVKQAPLILIPYGSEKLSVRYSMLLRQQSLTKEAFEYFQLMKKNTESIGSIFDPQPSELKGNIKCLTNPAEGVIGYLTASSFSEKRFFVTAKETNWTFKQDCITEKVKNNADSLRNWLGPWLPYSAEYNDAGTVILFYFLSKAPCVDCTARGGTLTRPSYW